ncbi:ABC transporter permease subunit [Frigoribacterium sp. 2-23]|uniref:ABC transporter permease subunit n=1 Tax=Frigoribacterium sp. 2-23 TaxID=3415006 RepID=UPI003C6FA5DC
MTTAAGYRPTRSHAPLSPVSFGGVLRSEWIKLRSLRSTIWCFVIMAAANVLLTLLVGATFGSVDVFGTDLTQEQQQAVFMQVVTAGVGLSQLVVAVLGALVIAGEFGTGMIRSTMTAVPRRTPALVAKALVLMLSTFVVSLVSLALSFAIAIPLLSGSTVSVDLGDAALYGYTAGAAGYLALIALLAFGFGTIIRNSAGAIAASIGLILVLPGLVGLLSGLTQAKWAADVGEFLPQNAGQRLFTYPTAEPVLAAASDTITLNAGEGALVLVAWAVVAFVVGAVLIKRRDV